MRSTSTRRPAHGVDAGNILNTIAAVYHSMGDNDRAIITYEQALAAAEPYGRPEMVALILGNIARIRSSRSEYLPAVSLGRRAVEIAREHSPSIVTNLLADLAEAYMGLADHQKAAECFAEARRVLAQMSDDGAEPSYSAQLGVMVAEGRVALRRGALDDAIGVLQAALDMSERTDSKEYELEINDLLATAFKRSGRFEEALERRETHDAQYRQMFTHAADLRLRTLQVAHETATARQQAEIFRLRHQDLDSHGLGGADARGGRHGDAVAPPRGVRAARHPDRVPRLGDRRAHRIASVTWRPRSRTPSGKSPEWCEQLRLAARLHDIGKVAVPDSVLRKTGPLTVEEYEMMKSHTSMGHRILAGNSAPMFQMAAEIAQSHHEWWDGSGYPLGHRALVDRARRPDRQHRRRLRRPVQQAAVQAGVVAGRSRRGSSSRARRAVRPRYRRRVRRRAQRPVPRDWASDCADPSVVRCAGRWDRRRSAERSDTQSPTNSASSSAGMIDPAAPPGVAERRHRAEHAEREQLRVGVGDLARLPVPRRTSAVTSSR